MYRYGEAVGKTFIIKVKTDDFTKGTFPKTKVEVIDVQWRPLLSEPLCRNPLSSAWNNFGPVILSLKMNSTQNYSYDFASTRRDYMDYDDENSFNFIQGQENSITLTVMAPYEYDVENHSIMIYAEFNNNGSFAGPGEEIVCKYIGDHCRSERQEQ